MSKRCPSHSVLGAIVLAAVAGCGGQGAPSSGPGTLHIAQETERSGAVYIEGCLWFVGIEASDGRSVLERRLPTELRLTVTIELDSGSYRFVSYQRPCDGNCSLLDAPTDRCERDFTIGSEQRLELLVGQTRRRPHGKCDRLDLRRL